MIDEKTMKKLQKKLLKVSDELTNENYHQEASFLDDLATYVENNPDVDVQTLVMWIAKYEWVN